MQKSRMIIIILIILLLVGTFTYYSMQRREAQAHEIQIHGNVDIRQVDLGFRVSGKLNHLCCEEGAQVKAGALLARLDSGPYQDELDNQRAQVAVASANLAKYQGGNRPQEVQEAKAALKEKEVAFDNAQKTLTRQADLVKKGMTSQQGYDDAFAAAKEAQAQLRTSSEALKLSQEGFRTEDIAAAKAQLAAAQAQLATAQTSLHDTDLFAPSDGIILTRIRELGSILSVGSPVYTLSLVDPIWIRAYVSEINLGHVKPGMQVKVFTDTDPNSPYTGQIGFISGQAEFTPKNIETPELRTDLVYRLRIVVADPKGQLRQGMPVTVKIPLSPRHE